MFYGFVWVFAFFFGDRHFDAILIQLQGVVQRRLGEAASAKLA
jgi:hypothetical protein